MESEIKEENLSIFGTCNLCTNEGIAKSLLLPYEYNGKTELYTDMLLKCFSIDVCLLQLGDTKKVICNDCIPRLRDAAEFREQVETSLKILEITIVENEVENIKTESNDADNYDMDCYEHAMKVENDIHVDEIVSQRKSEDEKDTEVDVNGSHYEISVDSNFDDYDDDEPLADISSKKKRKIKIERKTRKPSKVNKRRKRDDAKKSSLFKSEVMDPEENMNSDKLQMMESESTRFHMVEKPAKKVTESEQSVFKNVVKLIENSYVCPFDTSYSDYFCYYCRETFTDPTKLREHTLTHDTGTIADCFTNKKLPLIDISRIDCRLCPQTINTLEEFKFHAVNIHNITLNDLPNEILKFRLTTMKLACLECNATFSYFHALKQHMALHFGTCICDVCGGHYFDERMLILHQRKSHQRYKRSYPCQGCDKIFKFKHSLYLHETKTHKKEPVYQCSKCDDEFFSYSSRYRHMIDVHGEERIFQCEHCDKTYDSRKSLREHNRRNHLKILKHKCDLCEKSFYLPSRLKEHMVTHTGERNFKCELCGKTFPRLRGLKVHIQSHSSEKKFRCVLCHVSFTRNVNLKNHMKTQHHGN